MRATSGRGVVDVTFVTSAVAFHPALTPNPLAPPSRALTPSSPHPYASLTPLLHLPSSGGRFDVTPRLRRLPPTLLRLPPPLLRAIPWPLSHASNPSALTLPSFSHTPSTHSLSLPPTPSVHPSPSSLPPSLPLTPLTPRGKQTNCSALASWGPNYRFGVPLTSSPKQQLGPHDANAEKNNGANRHT